jgi:fucose 4-O-acetylase-like acetyltransferase
VGKTQQKVRDRFLDALKGFSILLVVAGHSIQTLPNFDDNPVFRFIYAFHMPLFMFLSGIVAACSLRAMDHKFIQYKALTLVVPFIAWYTVAFYLSGAYQTMPIWAYFAQLVGAPDFGLWFLWILFLNFCVLALAKKLQPKIGTASFVLVWLGVNLLPTVGWLGLPLLKWHLTFFLAGYVIYFYREKLRAYYKPAVVVSAIVFAVGIFYWRRTGDPAFAERLLGGLSRRGLSDFYPTILMIYKYVMPFAGIGLVVWALRGAIRSKYAYAVLAWFGVYTLDIYVSHQYFFQFAVGEGIVHVLSGTVIAVSLSLLVSFVLLRRVDILNRIFLGGRTVQRPAGASSETKRFMQPVMRYAQRLGLGGLIALVGQRWLP